jgi:maltose O-acetyltransferase
MPTVCKSPRWLRPFIRTALAHSPLIAFPRWNVALNRMLGYDVDASARIYSSTQIMGAIDVSIGGETFIGHESIITGGLARVSIGRNCAISDRVGIFCGTHAIDISGPCIAGQGVGKDVVIEDGVWIGFGALILPGVRVGHHAVVAAGAVVQKDVPPLTVVGGNPSRVIRSLVSE